MAVRRFVDEERPSRAVVIGAGYIGLEMAEALVRRGLHVTLLERSPQPMVTLDHDMGELIGDAMREMGIDVMCDCAARGIERVGRRVVAVATDTDTVPADIVVLGLGVTPGTELAAAAGVPVGETGGIITDDRMETRVSRVWAAGDCVEMRHRITGNPVAFALGTHANKHGRIAAENFTGGDARFPGVIGTAITKVCEVEIGRTGLTESEAAEAGYDTVAASVDTTTRASYYPGSAPITVKMVADRTSGQLLGAQIVGKEGAGKRIDTAALAVWNEMAVEEVAMLDLSYAPPLSPLWDPVLVAARRVADQR
jgi:NADPH-dependent 2,4-dienoyl-CoA reductase/sulfur reductase-like enzyme